MIHRHENKENGLTGERISWELQRAFYSFRRSQVLTVIPIQIAALLFLYAKGAGEIYLDMLPLLILISLLSTYLVCLLHGNQRILLLSLFLLTVGTMLQSLFKEEQLLKDPQAYSSQSLTQSLQIQYLLAIAAAILVGFLYWNLREISDIKTAELLTLLSLGLSLATLLLSKGVGGVKNWVSIGGFSVQTTEIIKFLYLFIAAALLGTVDKPDRQRLVGFYLVSFMDMGFLILEGEFGTLLLLLMVFFTFLFLFVPEIKVFLLTVISMGALAAVTVFTGMQLDKYIELGYQIGSNPVVKKFLSNYHKIANRVIYWMHPEKDADGLGYQLLKARESIVLGGWFGTSSVTDLPVKTSDLVFPALIQRCGMIFALLVFLIFILLWLEGMKVCVRKQDKYQRMMAVGLISMFLDQTIIIIAGSTGLCPLTGITLPFISSGGSSLVVSFMLMGVLLCISGKIPWKGRNSEEVTFFAKGTDCAKRILASGHHHVRVFIQNLCTGAGHIGRGRSAKSGSEAGGIREGIRQR